jgi:hypothetical protein
MSICFMFDAQPLELARFAPISQELRVIGEIRRLRTSAPAMPDFAPGGLAHAPDNRQFGIASPKNSDRRQRHTVAGRE